MSEMPRSISQTHDSELGPSDIQSLSNADEITAFFARLGYNTDTRISQTPANLGITAEGTARPIKKIELIADQESLFQVYLKGEDKLRPYDRQRLGFCRGDPCDRPREGKQ